MDIKNMAGVIIGAVIAVVLFATLLVPIVSNAAATEDTFENEGMWRMAANANGDTYTYDNTTHEWSLNGTVVNNAYSSGLNVILLDDLCIRSNGWIRGAQLTGNSVTTVVTNDNNQTIISGNGLSGNGTYALQGYGVNPEGDYLLTAYDKGVYMNGESAIYATGTTGVSGTYDAVFHIEGNIKDGVTITSAPIRNAAYTISDEQFTNVVIHYTPVSGYKDLYKLDGITFDYSCVATPTGEGDAVTITDFAVSYSSYVVPYEITAERSIHPDSATGSLLQVIPILAGIGIILGVLAVLYTRRE